MSGTRLVTDEAKDAAHDAFNQVSADAVGDALAAFVDFHATKGRDALVGMVREALIASPVIPLGGEPYVGWSYDLAVSVIDALFGASRLEES